MPLPDSKFIIFNTLSNQTQYPNCSEEIHKTLYIPARRSPKIKHERQVLVLKPNNIE